MENLTKEFVDKINKQIAEKAEAIKDIIFSDYGNKIIVELITKDMNDIRKLLDIRTKLME